MRIQIKRTIILASVLLIACTFLKAQSADEALRYSELRFSGTARGMGVAGAFGAIGADYSSILSNPGGLGLYRKSELTFSLAFDKINTESFYDGTPSDDGRFNVSVPNLSAVFAGKRKNDAQWKFINFGLGYNRLANFHSNTYYRSFNTDNSILETYDSELTGIPEDNIVGGGNVSLEADRAYYAWLVNAETPGGSEYSTVTDNTTVNQQISVEKRGAIDELSFAVATNFSDKVYFGGYFGIPFLFYKERIRHTEQGTASDSDNFNAFQQNRELNTFGIGVNFKMGVIYRPIDWLRLGAAFHTPTFYGVSDDFYTGVSVNFDTLPDPNLSFPLFYNGDFDYNLVTPARFVGSIGFIARKYAFFSFDYEWVDYSNAKYKMDNEYKDFELDVNDDISRFYSSANIYRAGVELALDRFRLRGGFAHYDSPYRNDGFAGDHDAAVNYYTFGIGIRFKKAFLDFAYVRSHSNVAGYAVNDELAYDEVKGNKFMITTGYRF